MNKFEGDFPDKALLETKYGESWSIKIEKIGEDYCLSHGWAQFVNYHQLEMCDLLLFKLIPEEEKLSFRVIMYGPNACEKELSFDTQCDPSANSDPAKHPQEYSPSSSTSMASPGIFPLSPFFPLVLSFTLLWVGWLAGWLSPFVSFKVI